jgi:hypothetical protein
MFHQKNFVFIPVFPSLETFPAHHSFLDFTILTVLAGLYTSQSSLLCKILNYTISSFSGQNIFLSTLSSNTNNLCSSLKARGHISQPNKTNGKTVLHILIFSF